MSILKCEREGRGRAIMQGIVDKVQHWNLHLVKRKGECKRGGDKVDKLNRL